MHYPDAAVENDEQPILNALCWYRELKVGEWGNDSWNGSGNDCEIGGTGWWTVDESHLSLKGYRNDSENA